MKRIIIANLIDWSNSFVDKDGTFYCGTTDDQKENATKIVRLSDLVIYTTDLHPITAPEHNINGGLYPTHNAVLPEQYERDFIYSITPDGKKLQLGNKTLSPKLTKIINATLENRKKGMIVPKGVYFQSGLKEPFCTPEEIEETFNERIISPEEFVNGEVNYVIAPKQYFDATRLDSDIALPNVKLARIPETNYNIFELIDKRFPRDKYERVHINTGVVEGICRLHTSIGLRQMFPFDRIINVADATTPLVGVGLGYETEQQSRDACMRVGKDIGIEYMTTEEVLKELKKIKDGN